MFMSQRKIVSNRINSSEVLVWKRPWHVGESKIVEFDQGKNSKG